ncbi:hypothetical protein EX895_004309 [Sporisorium graminicola]|uniref:Uncharacterized protein n=1 Tax=Sporisorium graminicola TaxID=280036 RepID=A0A4V6YEM6_9BASI|nr:hypothetical protein EX895_004309 [Sporisorium graminicola]TKY86669.1 hypothetical protein EX895_004309 [Sporisorium graminicola]
MPRGMKRRGSAAPFESSTGATDSPSAFKLVKYDTDRAGFNAHEPIVISDSDDQSDDVVDGKLTVRAALQKQEEGELELEGIDDVDEDKASTALHQTNLANLFTYRSPTKARAVRKADTQNLPKRQTLKPETSAEELFRPSTSSSKLLSALQTDTSAPALILAAESSLPAPKKSKAAKGIPRATIPLRKTLEAAKIAGVAPLDLDRVSSHGFRLILRCSFCAGLFAKSTSPKVKQQHMSLCAPLQGIEKSVTAVDTISSDISRALRRDEEDQKKAADNRTVLQDVMHDADILMHEGRASQIETSPKKRGKDKVVLKKAIKRSARPAVLVAEEPSVEGSPAPRFATHRLLPARRAMRAAREIANQLLGSAIALKAESSESGDADETLGADFYGQSSDAHSDAKLSNTPKKMRKKRFSHVDNSDNTDLFDPDDIIEQESHLPVLSAQQVFASMVSSSPHKSPVKALQKSRERQASNSKQSPGSPSQPQTQPFAPSKLAQRRQTPGDKAREGLFGAQTTTRSLLDLVRSHQGGDVGDASGQSKRKADGDDDDELAPSIALTKRVRLDDGELDPLSTGLDSVQSEQSHAPATRSSVDDDMDVDDQVDQRAPSTQSGTSTGKPHKGLVGKASLALANGMPGTDENQEQAPFPLEQTALNECSADSNDEVFDKCDAMTLVGAADSLDEILTEDDDEDTQSFLDLLEPLDVMHESIVSPI